MEKKITKKENYATLIKIVENSDHPRKNELLGFIDHEVELLSKKSSKTTMTATQKANLEILDAIREAMRDLGTPTTISNLNKHPSLTEYSSQKLSALVKKLVDMGDVSRSEVKKVAYFVLTEQGQANILTNVED